MFFSAFPSRGGNNEPHVLAQIVARRHINHITLDFAESQRCTSVGAKLVDNLGLLFVPAGTAIVLSLAPKSATAAVSMEISRLIGGAPAVTVLATRNCVLGAWSRRRDSGI
jgi:putative effector of murein hydrolase